MERNTAFALALAAALTAGTSLAASAPAKPPAAPVTLKAVIAKWSGQQVRIVKDGSQVEVKDLIAVGDDYLKVAATEGGETYIPFARIKALNVQGDKLFVHVN